MLDPKDYNLPENADGYAIKNDDNDWYTMPTLTEAFDEYVSESVDFWDLKSGHKCTLIAARETDDPWPEGGNTFMPIKEVKATISIKVEIPKRRNIVVIGYGRHGKNEVSLRIERFLGNKMCDSSLYMCEKVIFPVLGPKYDYKTPEECYEDRSNHRDEWYKLICDYNGDDNARLPREVFEEYGTYCGMRNRKEFVAGMAEGLFDLVIWVDARERRNDAEDNKSMTILKSDADIVIDNNGTLEDLDDKVFSLCRLLK